MEIYLDAVWLLNFLLDYMLLLLTSKLARLHTNRLRLAFGAAVASLIVPLSIYFPTSIITTVPGKIAFSFTIILCSFGYTSIYQLFKRLLLFYFVNFSVGGGLIAAHFLAQHQVSISNNGFLTYNAGYGDPISWLFVTIGIPIVWLFTRNRMDKHVQEKIRYDMKLDVTLKIKGESHSTNGFIDSGNQLSCPFTKKPVIICDEEFLLKWFEKEEWEQLKEAYQQMDMEQLPENWIDQLRIIPYQGVEGGNNFIFTISPDELVFTYNEQEIRTTEFLVGIQFGKLTKDGSYHCLLNPDLIQSAITYSA